uniref:Uncharacterized protein n=1 Tax=Arundo donax TaxID=35708 RepID=A0A0A9HBH6_ARUDO
MYIDRQVEKFICYCNHKANKFIDTNKLIGNT